MSKLKTFTGKFFRSNPQLASGGYETTRDVEATNESFALKKFHKIETSCCYGGMQFLGFVNS